MRTPSLPPLEPAGVGTAFVESLTSYVRRMAALLRVTNAALVSWLVPNSKVGDYTEAVNGTEVLGAELAEALARTTGIATVSRTSLYAVRGLHLRRDFNSVRWWCPLCLQERGYDMLVTTLRSVRSCPIHRVALVSTCVRGHQQRTLAAWARPDRCAQCGTLLGRTPASRRDDARADCAASIIGWLQTGRVIEPRRIAAWLRAYRGSTDQRECAEHFGWVQATVRNIESGAQRLQFSTVMTLMVRAETGILELHDLDPVGPTGQSQRAGPVTPIVDVDLLRAAVRAELQKPAGLRLSVAALAKEIGVNHVTLRRHVPEVDVLVAERRQAQLGRRRKAA